MEVRNSCVMCGYELTDIYKFEDFPVYMGVSDNDSIDEDVFEDMIWSVCECGCVQLRNLVDLSILYHKGHNSAYGKTWEAHHKQLSNFVNTYGGKSILEIGGGNLKLAELVASNSDKKFTVFDTNCDVSTHKNIITREEFFDYNNYSLDYDIDTIVHSHVLEHLYNPIEYMRTFYNMLEDGQRMIMSVPLLDEMVKDKFTNSINFEHTYMISEDLLHYMINRSGFKVIASEQFNKYNIFIACERTSAFDNTGVMLMTDNGAGLSVFREFIYFHNNFINKVNSMDGDGFYVFGGHIFTQYLLMFGLDESKFVCVLDHDHNKIGNRLYGTNLFVESPTILADVDNPVVVLRAAQFSEEIKSDILENINNKTIFIER